MNKKVIEEFYKKRTIYSRGFDMTSYMHRELKQEKLSHCKSPLFVGIRVTSYCNMNCPHCFVREKNSKMSLDSFIKMVDSLKKAEIYKITLTGGEIFTHSDCLKMIEYVKNRGFVMAIQTNGSLLDENIIYFLTNYLEKTDWIQISLDGTSIEEYYEMRNSMAFDDVIKNIHLLVTNNINVRINMVVTNKNYNQIKRLYDMVKSYGVKNISFTPLFGTCCESENIYLPTDENILKCFYEVIEANLKDDVNIIIDPFAVPWGSKELHCYDIPMGDLMCPAGKTSCEIDVNGDVYPCPFLFNDSHYMGNIFKDSMETIWGNEILDKLRNEKWVTSGDCFECDDYENCMGGCYAMAFTYHGGCDSRCGKVREKYENIK